MFKNQEAANPVEKNENSRLAKFRDKIASVIFPFVKPEISFHQEEFPEKNKISDGEILKQIKKIDQSNDLEKKAFAEEIIEFASGAQALAFYFEKFTGVLDPNEYAEKIIERGEFEALAQNIPQFIGLDHNEIVRRMMKLGDRGVWSVSDNLEFFHDLDFELALELVRHNQGGYVVNSFDNFKDLDREKLRSELMNHKQERWASEL